MQIQTTDSTIPARHKPLHTRLSVRPRPARLSGDDLSQNGSIVSHNKAAAGLERMKEEFLDCLARLHVPMTGLKILVCRALERGVTRDELVEWALAAHYSENYVRSLLCAVLTKSGTHLREPGAGRHVPQEALEILTLAEKSYGAKAGKFLLAAYRAFKKRAVAKPGDTRPADSTSALNASAHPE